MCKLKFIISLETWLCIHAGVWYFWCWFFCFYIICFAQNSFEKNNKKKIRRKPPPWELAEGLPISPAWTRPSSVSPPAFSFPPQPSKPRPKPSSRASPLLSLGHWLPGPPPPGRWRAGPLSGISFSFLARVREGFPPPRPTQSRNPWDIPCLMRQPSAIKCPPQPRSSPFVSPCDLATLAAVFFKVGIPPKPGARQSSLSFPRPCRTPWWARHSPLFLPVPVARLLVAGIANGRSPVSYTVVAMELRCAGAGGRPSGLLLFPLEAISALGSDINDPETKIPLRCLFR